jgi:hypothetical protein
MKPNSIAGAAFLLAALVALVGPAAKAQRPAPHKTKNVIVVMMDGLRWQEVFRGADPQLIKTEGPAALGSPKERTAGAQTHYGRETPAVRQLQLSRL